MFEKEIILEEQLAASCLFQCSAARKLPANSGVGLLKVWCRTGKGCAGSIAAHPCKKRKGGAPSVGMVQCKDGPPANFCRSTSNQKRGGAATKMPPKSF